jgi:drug/metabolite transporter (DMT)-like permease
VALLQRDTRPGRQFDVRVIAAYAAIYVVWGSTFLALRYAVASMPPLLTIALRSTIAGALLFGWAWLGGAVRVSCRDWRSATIGGCCFFVLCHGSLGWAEQHVSSGLAAVIMALIPVWVVILDWLRPGGTRPARATIAGMAISFGGVALLVAPELLAAGPSSDGLAALVLVGSALAWAAGSILSRGANPEVAPSTMAAMQLLSGGAVLLVVSLLGGEWRAFSVRAIEPQALAALAYLIVAGSLLTFSAYLWLLRVSSPARVATYAYVNPVVALLLGWAFGGEVLATGEVAAALLAVAGVALIISARRAPAAERPAAASEHARSMPARPVDGSRP